MIIKQGIHLTGKFIVEKGNRDGINARLEFNNVVLNVGRVNMLNRFTSASHQTYPKYLYLGTGTTEPKPTDLGLQSVSPTLAAKQLNFSSASQVINASEASTTLSQRFDYGEGEAEGTWTELGLAYGSTYTQPYNRSLFRDESGVPISLTVLSDEWLRVYVELTAYFPVASTKAGTMLVDGVARPYTIVYGTLYNGSFPPRGFWITGFPNEIRVNITGGGIGMSRTVDVGLKKVDGSFVRNPGSAFEASSINFIYSNSAGVRMFQLIPDPPIQKALEEQLVMTASIQWFIQNNVLTDGQATGGTISTLVDTTKSWTVDEFAAKEIEVYAGTGAGQIRTVASNTADTITVSVDWDTAPDSTSKYEVRDV